MKFEWRRTIGLQNGGFSYSAIAAEQCEFGSSGPTSTKQLEKLAADDGRWRQQAMIDTCSAWRWMATQLPPGSWQHVGLLLAGVLMSASSIHRHLLHCGLPARVPLYKIPLMANHRRLHLQRAHELWAWQAEWQQIVFSDNQASICRNMIAAFVLDAMSVNAAFQKALSNSIVAECLELWSRMRFYIMDDPICYGLREISVATGMSMKCYSPKSFLFFKAFQELSFSRIIQAHMLQILFATSVQLNTCNSFLDLLILRICCLLSTCEIWLVCVSLVIYILSF